ncbi:hypothetical protein KPL78_19550 [Roseomonas sp. HJA6]|uniref:Uncharacterized protein n=1 Tax=Roseomonas alba TaxID=2846776 RepID=A0ABS7ACM8_9PROT|nr:hypothetical protein [Neoroseomonas alba]MBW6400064.1 hypothetical protein [Neoroseomonas alba]
MLALPGAVHAQSAPEPIGTARMEADGTIILDLVARQGGTVGRGRLTYSPNHPDYDMIRRHLGEIRPGETKPVPPFP